MFERGGKQEKLNFKSHTRNCTAGLLKQVSWRMTHNTKVIFCIKEFIASFHFKSIYSLTLFKKKIHLY